MTTGSDAAYALPFDCISEALSLGSIAFPPLVSYRDASSPFTIDATLREWQITPQPDSIRVAIAAGVLEDADKGSFPLSGSLITIRLGTKLEAVAVVNPGALSELQQIGVLDAVSTCLNEAGIQFAVATLGVSSPDHEGRLQTGPPHSTALTGLLAILGQEAEARAALVIPAGLYLAQAVMPGLAEALGLADSPQPAFCFDAPSRSIVSTGIRMLPGVETGGATGSVVLHSLSMNIATDRMVAAAQAGWLLEPGIESTFTVICSHAPRYDAASRTLNFLPDPNPTVRPDSGIPIMDEFRFRRIAGLVASLLSNATAAGSSKCMTRSTRLDLPAESTAVPEGGEFHVRTAGVNGASVYLQGNWSRTQRSIKEDSTT